MFKHLTLRNTRLSFKGFTYDIDNGGVLTPDPSEAHSNLMRMRPGYVEVVTEKKAPEPKAPEPPATPPKVVAEKAPEPKAEKKAPPPKKKKKKS